MFNWKLRCLFCSLLLQIISTESADDGKALFFGLPVSLRSSTSNSSSPVNALLKSTFPMPDPNEGQDQNFLLNTNIPEEEAVHAISVDSTQKNIFNSEEPGAENEFLREDPLIFIPNLLQTEESASSAQRQPPSGVALAAIIRSAVALTRPLTSQRPTTIQYLFSKSNRGDTLREMISLAEGLVGRMGNIVAKQNPMEFLNIIDNMQNAVDRISGDGECNLIVELMNQTMITLKELMQMMNAVQKLGEMWSTVNISTLRKCIKKSGAVTAGTLQEHTSENENIESL